jgi:D-inositol-3-phosphate glycosyltransferase
MNVGVVAPQSSHWEDSHRAAAVLVKAFRRLGHSAWLITSLFHEGAPALDPDLVEKSETGFVEVEKDVSGVPTIRVLSTKPLLPTGAVAFRNFSRILGEIVDSYGLDAVVVLSSFWNGPEEAAKWAAVRRTLAAAGEAVRRIPLVYIPIYFPKFHATRPVDYASKVMWSTLNLPFILRQADLLVVCCPQEAAELRQFKTTPEKILISSNWIDPDVAEALDSTPAAPPSDFEYVISYIGPLRGDRNVHLFVKIADKLKTAAVVVAGAGEAADELRQEAKVRRNLVVIGSHEPQVLASVIKSSVAGVDFSSYEPMGVRALEYMYAGVPFAASPNSRAAWYVTNGVDGIHLSRPEAVDEFLTWVKMLVERPEVRDEMGRKAKKKAAGLTADKLAAAIIEKISS